MTRTQEQNEALLDSVVPMVHKLAWESYHKFGCAEAKHHIEDVQNEAMLIAWKAVLSWDEDKSRITTHVYTQVWGRLRHYQRLRVRLNGGWNYQKMIHADIVASADDSDASSVDRVGSVVDSCPLKATDNGPTAYVDLMDDMTPGHKRLLSTMKSTPSIRSFSDLRRQSKRISETLGMTQEELLELADQLQTRLGAKK